MSEEAAERPRPATPTTGNADVDAVLDDVDSLDQRPLEEHAAVFESAHDRLRRALEVGEDSADRDTDRSG